MNKEEITDLIGETSTELLAGNGIIMPDVGLKAVDFKPLMDSYATGITAIVTELNDSTINHTEPIEITVPMGIDADYSEFYSLTVGAGINSIGAIHFNSANRFIRKNPDSQALQFGLVASDGTLKGQFALGHNGPELWITGDYGGGPFAQVQSTSSYAFQTLQGAGYGYNVGLMAGDYKLNGYIGITPSIPTDIFTVDQLTGQSNFHYDVNVINQDDPYNNTIHFNKSSLLNQQIRSGQADSIDFVEVNGYDQTRLTTENGIASLTILNDINSFSGNNIILSEEINFVDKLFGVGYDGVAYNVLELNHKGVVNNAIKIGQGELTMDLSPDTTDDTFLIFGTKVSGNTIPTFKTENNDIIKLYQQELPTAPTTAEIATLLSNLGLASLV